MSVDPNYEPLIAEEGRLTITSPRRLVDACKIAGSIKDALTTCPDRVIQAIRPCTGDRVEALKGIFEYEDTRPATAHAASFFARYRDMEAQLGVESGRRFNTIAVWAILAGCTLSGQLYATIFMARGSGTDGPLLRRGLALGVGLLSLCLCGSVGCAARRAAPHLLRRWPESARVARRFLTVSMHDAIVMDRLPNMYGRTEEIVFLSFCTVAVTFVIISLVTGDAGAFAFGHVFAGYILTLGNSLAGESSSLQTIRAREILEAMEETARTAGIDLDRGALTQQLADFLAHPVHQDSMVVTLPFLAVLAATFDIPAADSVRIRRFVVRQGFVQVGDFKSWCRMVTARCDVVVDTFAEKCHILGECQQEQRWVDQGERLAWHMVLRPQHVAETEQRLKGLGLPLGAGLSSGDGMCGANEAMKQVSRYLETSARANAELEERTAALLGLCSLRSDDMADGPVAAAVLPLLQAGTHVNADYLEVSGVTPLLYASGYWDDSFAKPKTARLLVEYGADASKRDKQGRGFHQVRGQNRLVDELVDLWEKKQGKSAGPSLVAAEGLSI